MTPPLILCDKGDVALFESVHDLERYVESPDIAGYRVFDANGQVLRLAAACPISDQKKSISVVSVGRVAVSESEENAIAELEALLRDFLSRAIGRSYDQSALPELLTVLQATTGFTR